MKHLIVRVGGTEPHKKSLELLVPTQRLTTKESGENPYKHKEEKANSTWKAKIQTRKPTC